MATTRQRRRNGSSTTARGGPPLPLPPLPPPPQWIAAAEALAAAARESKDALPRGGVCAEQTFDGELIKDAADACEGRGCSCSWTSISFNACNGEISPQKARPSGVCMKVEGAFLCAR